MKFESPFGEFNLERFPLRKKELLQAWDRADDFLLHQLKEDDGPKSGERVLIVNDSFGALTLPLLNYRPDVFSDSYTDKHNLEENCRLNELKTEYQFIESIQELSGRYDRVLMKVPGSLAMLEDQLLRILPHLKPDTRFIAGGMIKYLVPAVFAMIEKRLGKMSTSLARKKARLIFIEPDPALIEKADGKGLPPVDFSLEGSELKFQSFAGIFAHGKVDPGTRLLIENLPEGMFDDIIDLGCGNGLLGIFAAQKFPDARFHFHDESFMAVSAARRNFAAAFDNRAAEFKAGDCLGNFPSGKADLILCNPPFHQDKNTGDSVAWRMFTQAKEALRPGGELRVVGNGHLGYQAKLRRIFPRVDQVAANSKFMILKALKED